MDQYQKFIHTSRYARYIPEESRRETWEETVSRVIDYFKEKLSDKDPAVLRMLDEAWVSIYGMETMPSMRVMMTAGPALDRDNVAAYNCAYLPIDHQRCFDELLYILMCGTGVGYSVERQNIQKLPEVPDEFHDTDSVIVVADSKVGWASSFRELLSLLWAGKVPKWDLSRIRPAGARLKTFGGRASGPEPLEDLFNFTVQTFKEAKGRKLNSLEVHDLCCKIAEIVVVGGVRRSAMISLSNLSDPRMRDAKSGAWWDTAQQRALANNSVAYTEKPDMQAYLSEVNALYTSKAGERGMFSRVAAEKQAVKNGRREGGYEWGTNPCSEIILRPHEFCNLTEVVVRPDDDEESLTRKVRIASFLGTVQSTLTSFRYLRNVWKKNCEEERLLGVSLTGIMDSFTLNHHKREGLPELLQKLRTVAVKENKKWAKILGINPSAAITCVKPSGTVSQLVNSASGIHARYSKHYIRRVRADAKDPLAQWMVQKGYPYEQARGSSSTLVFDFPVKSDGSVFEGDRSAVESLELWKAYQDNWCEHKPSCTIHYKDNEFLDCMAWVYKNFDSVSGVSFLPKDDHIYPQAPYEAISETEYDLLVSRMPDANFDDYREEEDNTTGSQELACTAGVCDIVDIGGTDEGLGKRVE